MTHWRPADPYRRRSWTATVVCTSLLMLLTLAVATGVTDELDVRVRETFRPHLMWGSDQQRAAHVVSALGPDHVLLLLAVGAAGVSLWRLNVWPLVQAAVAVAATGVLTLALKLLVDRGDPKGEHTSLGGSFPSGHSAILLVGVASGAMLLSCPTRWWQRLGVALLEAVLALAMLYDALHWLTDIAAGALTAGVVLGGVAAVLGPTGGPPHHVRRSGRRAPRSIPHSSDRTGRQSLLDSRGPVGHRGGRNRLWARHRA